MTDKCYHFDNTEKVCRPLEYDFPTMVGQLDQEQQTLIENEALPLVLIENATEIFSMIKDYGNFLETILEKLVSDTNNEFRSIGSFTFPTELSDNHRKNKESVEYDHLIQNIKERIGVDEKVIVHVALDLEDVGHYGIIFRDQNSLIVFDSMQHSENNQQMGFYSATFSQIAKDIFDMKPTISVVPNTKQCLQITGGFVDRNKDNYLQRLQNMDSQNHFCYMWAIWYTHLLLKGGKEFADKIVKEIRHRCIHPLVVIKKYTWAIMMSLFRKELTVLIRDAYQDRTGEKLTKTNVKYLTMFFLVWFRYVWDDLNNNKFFPFPIISCDMKMFKKMKSIDDCLEYSLSQNI